MEIEISVPDMITLKGDSSERSIRLENCHNSLNSSGLSKNCKFQYLCEIAVDEAQARIERLKELGK